MLDVNDLDLEMESESESLEIVIEKPKHQEIEPHHLKSISQGNLNPFF
jgi:hypothetical protein